MRRVPENERVRRVCYWEWKMTRVHMTAAAAAAARRVVLLDRLGDDDPINRRVEAADLVVAAFFLKSVSESMQYQNQYTI